MRCNVCGHEIELEGPRAAEQAEVRSNVRKFAGERFAVYRCPACKSIHARDEVDLAHYYADYPFHKLSSTKVDWMLSAMYENLLGRLRQVGITPASSVLDYGCGSGVFLDYLRSKGFSDVDGYDEYSDKYADKKAIARTYDCVMTQDVIEHVPDPHALVHTLDGLCKPGGIIVIGTPNAEAIDLKQPEVRVHTLHQPYHRHILSKSALLSLGHEHGWHLLRYYPTMYANTRVPFVNSVFVAHYFKCFDNNVDLALEPIRPTSLRLWSPLTLVHALFGSFYPPECDVMAVFRKAPAQLPSSTGS